ncbi:YbdK family carboxylate-amine ligase [Kitasatospora sp. NBC_00240]|uniref:carboxylate-amine ligase n=1 Tax=Kitasatospora sp. NBC_00240 TaxID=2903567 RepID=UPI00224D16CE|nr:YbdK family carboxylate-amine ligase [Kitasatospora sp. NBC_00240]MCX5215247.1 YbdK family carboxylate-amine ligase [Kitasatospora sp. NBC_00240]
MSTSEFAPRRPPLTLGVEEEFLLADRRTRVTVPRAGEVIADVETVLGPQVQSEFFATQVEVCTEPVATAGELRRQLLHGRRVTAAAARRADCLLVASASGILSCRPMRITDGDRYRRIAGLVGPLATGAGELGGCHVHLGTLSRADALLLSGRLRPWLPVFQALTVNSPFAGGLNRNCASWRSLRYARWPTVGPAPVLDERGYDELADRLVAQGTVLDRRMIYWYARPSEHLPTLEIRVADVNAGVDTTLLLALLLRGLAAVLLDEADRGVPGPVVSDSQLTGAHRQAALYGLRGTGVGPDGVARPMLQLLGELLRRGAPGLAATGDLEQVKSLLGGLLAAGTGAERQQAVRRRHGSLTEVVDDLAALTVHAG